MTVRKHIRALFNALGLAGALIAPRFALLSCGAPMRALPLWRAALAGLFASLYIKGIISLRARRIILPAAARITLASVSALACGLMAHAFACAMALCVPVQGAYGWALLSLPLMLCAPLHPALSRTLGCVAALLPAGALIAVCAQNGAKAMYCAPYAPWLITTLCTLCGMLACAGRAGDVEQRSGCLPALAGGLTCVLLALEGAAGLENVIAALCAFGKGSFYAAIAVIVVCVIAIYEKVSRFVAWNGRFYN